MKKIYVMPRTALMNVEFENVCVPAASMVGGCPDGHGDCGAMPSIGTDDPNIGWYEL